MKANRVYENTIYSISDPSVRRVLGLASGRVYLVAANEAKLHVHHEYSAVRSSAR